MRYFHPAILIAAVSACRDAAPPTQPPGAQAQLTSEVRYVIDHLPTLDARLNRPSGINNDSLVAGFVNRPGNTTRVAALWLDLTLDTLGTLGGPNSNVQWPGVSNSGMIVGIAETAELDPLDEEWSCTGFFPTVTGHICRGFFWHAGSMHRCCRWEAIRASPPTSTAGARWWGGRKRPWKTRPATSRKSFSSAPCCGSPSRA
jgi:hypothetical protein